MTFEQRKARAIAIMESKNMDRSYYAPPLLRLLWRMGFKTPPLPFISFWQITLFAGSFFELGFWVIKWLFGWLLDWQHEETSLIAVIVSSIVGGLFFGVFTAVNVRWTKTFHDLPDWDSLD
ncbi:hypothetical protein Xsto_03791 [Xenorhabdus stockiae]|uniref:Uncharacterized protein n=1 Tax=Xenorhabdus stockiae TaxID=351614 RepID=A0A2D0KAY9_9GAMM|nr:DUF6404 family protein [Xenorhabdus stockiae]PHM60634.1 hypothetical protein Xsto_03791 [Xenorhabdus stockiae]